MSTTPIYNFTEWAGPMASPWDAVNAAMRLIEALIRGSVSDRDLTAPPGACADGAAYLVDASATGAWATHDGEFAVAVGVNAANGWAFADIATEGFILYVADEDVRLEYRTDLSPAGWRELEVGGIPAEATAAEIRTGTVAEKYVSPDKLFDAAAYVALNDSGGNIAVDLASGFNFTMTMDGDYTLSAPTNGKPGQTGVIVLTQDGTGTQTLAYNAAWKFAGGDPVLSTAAGAVDLLFYQVLPNGSDVYANLVKAIA